MATSVHRALIGGNLRDRPLTHAECRDRLAPSALAYTARPWTTTSPTVAGMDPVCALHQGDPLPVEGLHGN